METKENVAYTIQDEEGLLNAFSTFESALNWVKKFKKDLIELEKKIKQEDWTYDSDIQKNIIEKMLTTKKIMIYKNQVKDGKLTTDQELVSEY